MGIFGNIMGKLGGDRADRKAAQAAAASGAATGGETGAGPAGRSAASGSAGAPATGLDAPSTATAARTTFAPRTQPLSEVDVVARLEALASASPEKLNWKTSVVDLMKLLGLDSSLAVRKELATELGCPPEKMRDSAQMNVWLHRAVMQKLAENGGNIPQELLH